MLRYLAVVFALSGAIAQQAAQEPRNTPPRTASESELAPLLRNAEQVVAKGGNGEALLKSAELSSLREVTEFRRMVREHAPVGEATMVPAGEPGTPMIVRGAVLDRNGKPIVGATVYAYNTSAKGWYSDRAPHFSGNGGDFDHARLFAYVRTDGQGQFVLHTVRPGGYPRSTLPEHIHWQVLVEGKSVGIGEVWFDDDPRLTKEARERAGSDVCVAKVERTKAGLVVRPTLVVLAGADKQP